MAKVEFTCTDEFKEEIKKFASLKGLTVASYVKATISDKMVSDERKRK